MAFLAGGVRESRKRFIVTGGLGAGKSKLIERISATGLYVIGSPADTMKKSLARAVATTFTNDMSSYPWHQYFSEMVNRGTKERYRDLLQAFGEFFSNQDPFFWINRVMSDVETRIWDIRYQNDLNVVDIDGTLYDSIRRPHEILGVRRVYPDAVRVHLQVSRDRQIDYLTNHQGYSLTKAYETLNHPSENWLVTTALEVAPDITIGADGGDDKVWETFQKEFRLGKEAAG